MKRMGLFQYTASLLGCFVLCPIAAAQGEFNPSSFSAARAEEEPVKLTSTPAPEKEKPKPKERARVANTEQTPTPQATPLPQETPPPIPEVPPPVTPPPDVGTEAAGAAAGAVGTPGAVPVLPGAIPVPAPEGTDNKKAKPKKNTETKTKVPKKDGKPAADEKKPADQGEAKPPEPPKDYHAETPTVIRKRLEIDVGVGLGMGASFETDLMSFAFDGIYDLEDNVKFGIPNTNFLAIMRYQSHTGAADDDDSRVAQALSVGAGLSYKIPVPQLRLTGYGLVGTTKLSKWNVVNLRYSKSEYGFAATILTRANYEFYPGIEALGGAVIQVGSLPWFGVEFGLAARF